MMIHKMDPTTQGEKTAQAAPAALAVWGDLESSLMEWFGFVVAGPAAVSRCEITVAPTATLRTICKHSCGGFFNQTASRNRPPDIEKRAENRTKAELCN